MDKPLVSVLMTAYNREKYIGEAIESVLASTFKNFELIISDDGSSDGTVEIAKTYAEKDSRVKLFVNEKNVGDYNNRNKAASYATGKYLKYLDSDDIIYPYSLALMADSMEQYPNTAYAFSASHVHTSSGTLRYPVVFTPEQGFREHFLKGGFYYSGPGGVIFRADIFREFNGFSGRRFLGDMELLMKIGLQYPVLMIQPALIWWRIHDEQEQNIEFKDPSILAHRYNLAIDFLHRSQLSAAEKKKAKESIDKMLARHFFRIWMSGDREGAFNIKKLAGFTYGDLLKAFNIKNKLRSVINK